MYKPIFLNIFIFLSPYLVYYTQNEFKRLVNYNLVSIILISCTNQYSWRLIYVKCNTVILHGENSRFIYFKSLYSIYYKQNTFKRIVKQLENRIGKKYYGEFSTRPWFCPILNGLPKNSCQFGTFSTGPCPRPIQN